MKTFKFTLKERNGEQEYSYDYLVYADSYNEAEKRIHSNARQWYADPDVEYNSDSGYYEFFGGCLAVSVTGGCECTVEEFAKDLVNRYTLR